MRKRFLYPFGVVFVCVLVGVSFWPQHKQRQIFKELEQNLSQEIKQGGLPCSVLVKDLTYPELEFASGGDKKFIAASLIKIHILGAALQAVREGRFSLNHKVTVRRKDVSGGSGKIKAMKLPVTFTLRELLELMIVQSDNTATNKIINIVGLDYMNRAFDQLGASRTILRRPMMDFVSRRKGIENYTTVYDVAFFLEKIYNKELVSRRASELALSLLKEQRVSDRLPRYLPEAVEVAHKTGLERGIVHDAGIVFAPRGDYIICVLVRGVKDYEAAKEFIGRLSLLVYNIYK